ncbi:MAG: iron uptake porin [Cyanobacteria bacterium P01_H01_bin.21]
MPKADVHAAETEAILSSSHKVDGKDLTTQVLELPEDINPVFPSTAQEMMTSPQFSHPPFRRFSPSIHNVSPTSQAIASSIADRDTHVSADVPNNGELEHSPTEIKLSEEIILVDELTDVAPDDWGVTVLQRFSETYGCAPQLLQGAGTATISRYEFVVFLQNCLEQVQSQTHSQSAQVNTEALEALEQLSQRFATELGMLQQDLEGLEDLTQTIQALEENQFSTTTTLRGGVLLSLATALGNEQADTGDPIDSDITFGSRVRLNFDTSFSGEDRLRIRLQARNVPELDDVTGTNMAKLGFDGADGTQVEISDVTYRLPLGWQGELTLAPVGGSLGDFVPSINGYFSSSSNHALSEFGTSNPVLSQGSGTGVGLSYDLNNALNLSIGYAARDTSDANRGFGNRYGVVAQITAQPVDPLTLGLSYVHSFNQFDTGTGSALANDPFDDRADAIRANSLGLEASLDLGPGATLGGRVGFMQATAEDLPDNPTASVLNWSAMLAFSDLGGDGNLGGFFIGQPPRVTSNDLDNMTDPDTSLHLELFYRWQLNRNISITPGIFVVTNPEHNQTNSPIYVGAIRTHFRF